MRMIAGLITLTLTCLIGLAGHALAQEPVTEVSQNGTHCPAGPVVGTHSVAGGCVVHVISAPGTTIDLIGHVPFFGEFIDGQCTNEYDLHIGDTGAAAITNASFSADCTTAPCEEEGVGQDPWPVTSLVEDHATGHLEAEVEFCIISQNFGQIQPDLHVELSDSDSDGDYDHKIPAREAAEEITGAEVHGEWVVEGGDLSTTH